MKKVNVEPKEMNQIFVWCEGNQQKVNRMSNEEKMEFHKQKVEYGEACSWCNSYEDFMTCIDEMNNSEHSLNYFLDTNFPCHFTYYGSPVELD